MAAPIRRRASPGTVERRIDDLVAARGQTRGWFAGEVIKRLKAKGRHGTGWEQRVYRTLQGKTSAEVGLVQAAAEVLGMPIGELLAPVAGPLARSALLQVEGTGNPEALATHALRWAKMERRTFAKTLESVLVGTLNAESNPTGRRRTALAVADAVWHLINASAYSRNPEAVIRLTRWLADLLGVGSPAKIAGAVGHALGRYQSASAADQFLLYRGAPPLDVSDSDGSAWAMRWHFQRRTDQLLQDYAAEVLAPKPAPRGKAKPAKGRRKIAPLIAPTRAHRKEQGARARSPDPRKPAP